MCRRVGIVSRWVVQVFWVHGVGAPRRAYRVVRVPWNRWELHRTERKANPWPCLMVCLYLGECGQKKDLSRSASRTDTRTIRGDGKEFASGEAKRLRNLHPDLLENSEKTTPPMVICTECRDVLRKER